MSKRTREQQESSQELTEYADTRKKQPLLQSQAQVPDGYVRVGSSVDFPFYWKFLCSLYDNSVYFTADKYYNRETRMILSHFQAKFLYVHKKSSDIWKLEMLICSTTSFRVCERRDITKSYKRDKLETIVEYTTEHKMEKQMRKKTFLIKKSLKTDTDTPSVHTPVYTPPHREPTDSTTATAVQSFSHAEDS